MKKILLIAVCTFSYSICEAQETLQSVTERGSTTTRNISFTSGTDAIKLVGNSHIFFADALTSARNGYIQHAGSEMSFQNSKGGFAFNGTGNNWFSTGSLGIGTSSPQARLDLGKADGITLKFQKNTSAGDSFLRFFTESGIPKGYMGIFGANNDLYLDPANSNLLITSGNVGIGTMFPTEKLAVKGVVRAQEVKVDNENWPDYVFNDNYASLSLTETEAFIKANKHLPEIPSAIQVKEEGILIGEMNARLLKKIEELTLHLIRQEKDMLILKKEVQLLKKQKHK